MNLLVEWYGADCLAPSICKFWSLATLKCKWQNNILDFVQGFFASFGKLQILVIGHLKWIFRGIWRKTIFVCKCWHFWSPKYANSAHFYHGRSRHDFCDHLEHIFCVQMLAFLTPNMGIFDPLNMQILFTGDLQMTLGGIFHGRPRSDFCEHLEHTKNLCKF